MYFLIRTEGNEKPVSLIVAQAETVEKAKEMTGVPEHCSQWTHINDDFLSGLVGVKEGYIVKQL